MNRASILMQLASDVRDECKSHVGSCVECTEAKYVNQRYSCAFCYVKDLLFYKPLSWNLEEIRKGLKETGDEVFMNGCQLIGNLTSEPKKLETEKGEIGATFTIAVDGKGKNAKTEFLTISAWRAAANYMLTYCNTGDRISVVGRLSTRKIKDERGREINVVGIVAEEVRNERKAEKKDDNSNGRAVEGDI